MKLDADEKQLLESAERGRVEVRPRWQAREASTALLPRHLQNHVWPVLGAVPIARMARGDVKRLLVGLRAKELRAKTVTGILRTLSTVLSEAVEDGNLPANPALRPGRLRRQLPEWYAFLLCAFRTGLRLGELRALEWGDLDWRQRFIRVERNFVEGHFTTPKNGLARNVDMSLLRVHDLRHIPAPRCCWCRASTPES